LHLLERSWGQLAQRLAEVEAGAAAERARCTEGLRRAEARCSWAEEQLREHAAQLREHLRAGDDGRINSHGQVSATSRWGWLLGRRAWGAAPTATQ
jgi:hypothetical protein